MNLKVANAASAHPPHLPPSAPRPLPFLSFPSRPAQKPRPCLLPSFFLYLNPHHFCGVPTLSHTLAALRGLSELRHWPDKLRRCPHGPRLSEIGSSHCQFALSSECSLQNFNRSTFTFRYFNSPQQTTQTLFFPSRNPLLLPKPHHNTDDSGYH